MKTKLSMISKGELLTIKSQYGILGISNKRSGFYYDKILNDDTFIANMISDIYASSDFIYGYRKITACLNGLGYAVNHKKVLRIMQQMGFYGRYPRKKVSTTKANILHKKHSYLLADININAPNKVWSSDITYIRIKEKFLYLVAIIDVYSRYIISYDLSNCLDKSSCIKSLESALLKSKPEIFNTDQGCQFTSNEFIEILLNADIKISMAHRGRCFDNIHIERFWRTLKQESIYFYNPQNTADLEYHIDQFILWYNNERVHQSLNYSTPEKVYKKGESY